MKKTEENKCNDKKCWMHGSLKVRGRKFKGYIIRKFPKRITIEFERTLFIKKFERYIKKKTKIHAWLPACKENAVNVGDYVSIGECRPLSKIIHFTYLETIRKAEK